MSYEQGDLVEARRTADACLLDVEWVLCRAVTKSRPPVVRSKSDLKMWRVKSADDIRRYAGPGAEVPWNSEEWVHGVGGCCDFGAANCLYAQCCAPCALSGVSVDSGTCDGTSLAGRHWSRPLQCVCLAFPLTGICLYGGLRSRFMAKYERKPTCSECRSASGEFACDDLLAVYCPVYNVLSLLQLHNEMREMSSRHLASPEKAPLME